MSTWTILALGAKVPGLPVIRSSNLMPSPRTRSARSTAMLAQYMPCMPSMPRLSGWLRGKELRPSRVFTTGIWVFSESSTSSAQALEANTPWPAIISGFLAWSMSWTASARLARVSGVRWSE